MGQHMTPTAHVSQPELVKNLPLGSFLGILLGQIHNVEHGLAFVLVHRFGQLHLLLDDLLLVISVLVRKHITTGETLDGDNHTMVGYI